MRVVLDSNILFSALISALEILAEADDPDDAFLLAMAVEGKADYLVTGDHRAGILQLGHIGRARIVTPAQFREEVLLSLTQPSLYLGEIIEGRACSRLFSQAGRGSTARGKSGGGQQWAYDVGAAAPPPHSSVPYRQLAGISFQRSPVP